MRVELDQESWNRVLAVLSQAPWSVANPLIMAIGEQLRAQAPLDEVALKADQARAYSRPNGPQEPQEGRQEPTKQ